NNHSRGHDRVVFLETDSPDTGGRPAHRADVLLREPDAHAVARDEDDFVLARRQFDINQRVARLDSDGDDAAFADIGELLERGLFYGAQFRREEDEPGLLPRLVFVAWA